MDTTHEDLDHLAARIRVAFDGYLTADRPERATHTTDAAEAVVSARVLFEGNDGEPDYRGRSAAYRQWLRETYARTGASTATIDRFKQAVRWHVAAALRERYPEAASRIGLSKEGFTEKAARRRAVNSRTLSIFSTGDPITDPDDIRYLAAHARAAVRRVGLEEGSAPQHEAAGALADLAEETRAAVSRLRGESVSDSVAPSSDEVTI